MAGGGDRDDADDSGRPETRKERIDRELIELLNELRVAIPGIQMLFAFLLTVPFTQRFAQVTAFQRHAYFGTLVCAAIASALLIAPTAQHRLLFRQHEKGRILERANRQAVAGLAFLALAIVGTVMVVTDVIFKAGTTTAVTAALAVLFVLMWFVQPLVGRSRDH